MEDLRKVEDLYFYCDYFENRIFKFCAASPGIFLFGRNGIVVGWQIGVNVKIVEQFRDGPLVLGQLLLHFLPGIASNGQAAAP